MMISRAISNIFASTTLVNRRGDSRSFWNFRNSRIVAAVEEMRQDLKIGFSDVTTSITMLNESLREIKGFTGHISTSLEQEVVLRVHKALADAGLKPKDLEFNVHIHDLEASNTVCSLDGLIGLGDGSYAVIEVGDWVNSNLLAQMKYNIEEMTRVGYRVSHKFVGGLDFELATMKKHGAMEHALRYGYAVVYPTASRYEVVYPSGPVPHLWPKGPHAPLPAPTALVGDNLTSPT